MNIEINPKNSMDSWYATQSEIEYALKNNLMMNPCIDLTNACNLNCPYCYIEDKNSIRKKRKPNELSISETLRIVDCFVGLGARSIDIVGAGEPTIDEHFRNVIDYIYKSGCKTSLFTNGILLSKNPDLINFLFERNVTVILKLNSFNEEIQDLVAGKSGYFTQMKQALEKLLEKGFNRVVPTRLSVNTIAFQGNLHELSKIHYYCRKNNIYPMTGDYIPTGRTEDGGFVAEGIIKNFDSADQNKIKDILKPLSSEQRQWLINELKNIDKKFGIEHSGCPSYYGGSICTQQLGLYVDIEGNVWPCVARSKKTQNGLINGILGNIRQGADLKQIWNNDSYLKSIREHFTGGCPYKYPL